MILREERPSGVISYSTLVSFTRLGRVVTIHADRSFDTDARGRCSAYDPRGRLDVGVEFVEGFDDRGKLVHAFGHVRENGGEITVNVRTV